MCLNQWKSQLFVSYTDNKVYRFDIAGVQQKPAGEKRVCTAAGPALLSATTWNKVFWFTDRPSFLSSVQDGIYALWKVHIFIPPCPSEVSPTTPLKQFLCSSDWLCPLLSFQGSSPGASSWDIIYMRHSWVKGSCCSLKNCKILIWILWDVPGIQTGVSICLCQCVFECLSFFSAYPYHFTIEKDKRHKKKGKRKLQK